MHDSSFFAALIAIGIMSLANQRGSRRTENSKRITGIFRKICKRPWLAI